MTTITLISPPPYQTLGNPKLVGGTILGLITWFAVYWQLEPHRRDRALRGCWPTAIRQQPNPGACHEK